MRIFYHDQFVLPLPEGHRFPMSKYSGLRQRIESDPAFTGCRLLVGPSATDEDILTVHDPDYLHRIKSGRLQDGEARRIGFPWSPQMVERSRRSVGSTIAAARAAFEDGVSVNLAGGTHHSFADRGEGYCVFNDVAVAIGALRREGRIRRALVFDCDVHQGNGTARIFTDDPDVFTVSLHGATNYPFRKEQSDLDVALADGTEDAEYLTVLDDTLEQAFAQPQFDITFYLSGADPFKGDRLGKLSLSKHGLAERDRRVFARCAGGSDGVAGVPVAVSMGGGYAANIDDIVDIHHETVRAALTSWMCASP